MTSTNDQRLPSSEHLVSIPSQQHGRFLPEISRKKHRNRTKSMSVIHTRIRPHSISACADGNKHIKDPRKKSHTHLHSISVVSKPSSDAKQFSNIDSKLEKNENSKIVGNRSSKSSKVLPLKDFNSDSSMRLNNCREIKMVDDWNARQWSRGELREIVEHTKNRRRRRRICGALCPCSPCCLLFVLFTGLLLGIVLAIILLRFLPQSTTVKMSSSTSTSPSASNSTSTLTSTSPSTSTSTTTSTSTSTTSTSTTTSMTSTSMTTTFRYICNSSCVNQSWISVNNLLAEWEFDNNLTEDVSNTVSAANQSPSYVSGYVDQALLFGVNANESVTSSPLSLANSDFTIDAWIYPTGFPNLIDHSIVGLCPLPSNYECLYLTIRKSGSNSILYFGLFGDDCPGNTYVILNQWIHVAFVFAANSYIQSIYINGVLDVNRTASGSFKANSSAATIGDIPVVSNFSGPNYFQGIIDRLKITTREKSNCEILEEATLSVYCNFDSATFLTDSGPNSLPVVGQSVSLVSTGHSLQAISFNGSTSSYFQISDVTSIGIVNRSFSISVWVRPQSLTGRLVHVSGNSTGLGWCIPFLGFAANGSVVAQLIAGVSVRPVFGPAISLAPAWTHIVQTWSLVNGLRLYINNVLVATRTSNVGLYSASLASMYVTLGNSLDGASLCATGPIGSPAPFTGDMDEFRIYSRELNADDVCALYDI